MADRDWDKELAKIDKQLASLSDDELLGAAAGAQANAPRGKARTGGRERASRRPPSGRRATFGVYARLALAVRARRRDDVWPYEARCGFGLAGYLARGRRA